MHLFRRISGRWTLIALAVWLLPALAVGYLTRVQLFDRADDQIRRDVSLTAAHVGAVFEKADRLLTRLAEDTRADESDDALRQLRRQMYINREFREFGVLDGRGRLVVSSLGRPAEPIPVPPADRSDPGLPRTQLVGRRQTAIMREFSVVVARPTAAGGEVNLLIDPAELLGEVDPSAYAPGGYFAVRDGAGHPLAWIGSPDGTAGSGGGIERAAPVPGTVGGGVVAYRSRADIMASWPGNLGYLAAGISLLNALGLLALRRYFRAPFGWKESIARGIAERQFRVVYQPVIDLATGGVRGVEALLRWAHPQWGTIPPDRFIPAAESSGMITPLTDWLFREILAELGPLLAEHPLLYVCINIAPETVLEPRFAGNLAELLLSRHVSPGRIVLEITERSSLEERLEELLPVLAELRGAGVRIALDDFGTGYSSLSCIHRFHFDILKIDRAFTKGLGADTVAARVAEIVLGIGEKLELAVVAEGVETEVQRRMLIARGITVGQGWLFSKALPLAELTAFLRPGRDGAAG